MDRKEWLILMEASRNAARAMPPRTRRATHSDLLILRMWLWAVAHDRPLSWACRRENYTSMYRPRRLASVSRFSRRLRTMRFVRLRVLLHHALTEHARQGQLSYIDGKALPVGEHTTDPDARNGVISTGRFRIGYKLHARVNRAGYFEEYRVTALNKGEAKVARKLVRSTPQGGLVLADSNYDSRILYRAVDRHGAQMFTPVKGIARAASTFRQMPESRKQAVLLWRRHPELASWAMKERATIERIFAHLCGFGGGLGPLPAWVRRLHRVRLWLDAKIAIYHARLIVRTTANMTS